jgi:hypothetical protein
MHIVLSFSENKKEEPVKVKIDPAEGERILLNSAVLYP